MNRLDGCVYTVPDAHHGIINAIDTAGSVENHGASEIVTGGQDGIVKVWDPRCNEAVVHIEPTTKVSFRTTFTTLIQVFFVVSLLIPNHIFLQNSNGSRDCWAVAFGDAHKNDERCVCAGFDNGDIRVFDLRILRIRWESNVRNGVVGLETNNKYEPLHKLVATTTFGGLNMFDFSKGSSDQSTVSCISKIDADELPNIQQNHDRDCKTTTPTIWCVRHLPQNSNIFATCGGSGTLRIWHRYDHQYFG